MSRKQKINRYFEIVSIFCTIIFLNLLGLLTINIGCKVLNPAFTTSGAEGSATATTNEHDDTTKGEILSSTTSLEVTSSVTSNITSGMTSNITSNMTSGMTSNITTSELPTTSSGAETLSFSTGNENLCGNCQIDELEDCDPCTSQLNFGICDECWFHYPLGISEHSLALYCQNFDYCGEPGCGQCEADAICHILYYKLLVKTGVNFDEQKMTGVGWVVQEIDPMVTVTLTYEEIPNSFLIPDNGASYLGYFGDIWLSEKPFYMTGLAMQNVSCTLGAK